MGRPASKARPGDLVIELTPAQINDTKRHGVLPRTGPVINLWQLPGRWAVWSEGPKVGTWWLTPHDDEARRTGAAITAKPARGVPVVVEVWKDCIAVRSAAIKPSGWNR